MAKARSVTDVILGEATYGTPEERLEDMLAIASVIANRAEQLGVTPEEVVSAPGEFSAYNKDLPAGVEAYRDLAEQAIAQVEQSGPVNDATFYATPTATKNLPQGLEQVGTTTGHTYFSDPLGRSIQTAVGYREPTGGIVPASAATSAATADAPLGLFGGLADYARTGPAGITYGDLVAPTPVQTTKVSASPSGLFGAPESTTPGPGLAALAPNGLVERYGPNRPNRPNEGIIGIADKAVKDVLGADWSPVGTSGMENPGQDYSGAGRHPTGDALDFYAENTKTGQVATHEQMANVAQQAAAIGATGVGFGAGYMDADGVSKVHIDTAKPNKPGSWGKFGTRFTMDPTERAKIMGGMVLGTEYDPMPGFAVPTDNPMKMTAPVGVVESAPLGPIAQPEYAQAAQFAPGLVQTGVLGPASSAIAAPTLGGLALAPDSYGGINPQKVQPIAQPSISPIGATETVSPSIADPAGIAKWGGTPTAPLSPEQERREAYLTGAARQMAQGLLSPTLRADALLGAPSTLAQQETALAAQKPTLGIPQAQISQSAATSPAGAFPAAPDINKAFPAAPAQPKEPTRLDRVKQDLPSAMKRAAIGTMFGGLPGGAIGLASGLLGGQISDAGLFGPGFDSLVGPNERFSVGSGLKGMQASMGGPKGATAKSTSGSTYTSLGPGLGGLRRSDRFGWTEVVNANGEVVGIRYDNPAEKGIFGSLSNMFGGLFGGSNSDGSGFSQAEKDAYSGKAGLW